MYRNQMSRGRGAWLAIGLAGLGGVSWLPSQAIAVQPQKWTHTTEADFEPGKVESVVTTNLGDIKLSAATSTTADLAEQAGVVFDLQPMQNGTVYLATGPDTGRVLSQRGGKIETVAELENEQVFALDVDAKGRLLAAVSADSSRIAVLEGDKLVTLVQLDGVRYIWDMLVVEDRIFLATGTHGRVLMVDLTKLGKADAAAAPAKKGGKTTQPAPIASSKGSEAKTAKPAKDAKPAKPAQEVDGVKDAADGEPDEAEDDEPPLPPGVTEVFRANQANILCLGRDKLGRVYAGTDTDGLVYRFTLKPDGNAAESFVLFDAPEPEVGALFVQPDGTVYLGTSDANQARPERLVAPAATEAGRLDPAMGNLDHEPALPPEVPNLPQKPLPTNEPESKTQLPAKSTGPGIKATDFAKANFHANVQKLADTPQPAPESDDAAAPDAIRNAIRQQLDDAKQTGTLPALAGPARPGPRPRNPAQQRDDNKQGGQPNPNGPQPGMPMPDGRISPEGNAVYRISPDGFVTEIFREACIVLRIVPDGEKLLIATGNQGRVYSLDPAAGETTIVARLEPSQLPAMVRLPDQSVLLGTANPASLVRLDPGFARQGQFTSAPLDAGHTSLWGKFNITLTLAPETAVTVETRSGNVQDPDHAAWSAWSKPQPLKPDAKTDAFAPRQLAIESPPARFLQYRLTLQGDGKTTPVIDRLDTAYVVPNIKPAIKSITVNFPDSPRPTDNKGSGLPNQMMGMQHAMLNPNQPPQPNAPGEEPPAVSVVPIEWDASDPNGDTLRFTLEAQAAGSGKWLPLAKDLDSNAFEWQTRRVPDGRYIVRVTASDAPSNTPDMALVAVRNSDPVVIDNSPPAIDDIKTVVNGRTLTLTAKAADSLSLLKSIHYGLDTTEKWNTVLPDDLICDSTTETFSVRLFDLSPGPHVVTIRVVDSRGNAQYKAVAIEVKAEAKADAKP